MKTPSWRENAARYLTRLNELAAAEEQLREVRHVIYTDPRRQSISRSETGRKEKQLRPYQEQVNRLKKILVQEKEFLLAESLSLKRNLMRLPDQRAMAYRTANQALSETWTEWYELERWLVEHSLR